MAKLKTNTIASSYKNLVTIDNTIGSGFDGTARKLQDGAGSNVAIGLGTDIVEVQGDANSTSLFKVNNIAGQNVLRADSVNNEVKLGTDLVFAMTSQEVFYWESNHDDVAANTWYNMFHSCQPGVLGGSEVHQNLGISLGTGSEPSTTITNSTASNSDHVGNYFSMYFWRLFNKIRIDSVHFDYMIRHEGAAASSPVVEIRLYEYTNSDGYSGSSGNFASGTKLASHSSTLTCTSAHKSETLTIDLSQIDTPANKVVVPTVRLTTVGDYDMICKLYVNYHLY
tara:strand:+ start:1165 stop:2010 length:846 start_codon:yes stop_codon:yes gene_type:complete